MARAGLLLPDVVGVFSSRGRRIVESRGHEVADLSGRQ